MPQNQDQDQLPENKLPTPSGGPASTPDITPSDLVQPLETLNSDVEKYLKQNQGNEESIAAVLKHRRHEDAPHPPAPVEPSSLVLPNPEIHSPFNAIRATAGTLLAQEKNATLPTPPPIPKLVVPPKSQNQIDLVETYQGDIANLVKEKKISQVTIVAAEAVRSSEQSAEVTEVSHIVRNSTAIAAGILLVAASSGMFAFAYLRNKPSPQTQTPNAFYIAVDASSDIAIKPMTTRHTLLDTLQSATNQTHIALGLISQLRLWTSSSTSSPSEPLPAQTFFTELTPNIPPELVRSMGPDFLVGVHSFDINQPFFIFTVDSYQSGYAGMLEWERTLRSDVSPLFDYTPVSSKPNNESLESTTTPIVNSAFRDLIVENHDARVIKNTHGDIVLLWTFLDRTTVLITTNPNTVHEIITRLKKAPILFKPGKSI